LRWTSTWFGSWARVVPFTLTRLLAFAATYTKGSALLLDGVMSLLPGFGKRPTAGGAEQLLTALLLIAAIVVAGYGTHWAIRFGMRVYVKQLANPRLAENIVDLIRNRRFRHAFSLYRSYLYSWVIGGIAVTPLVLAPLWLPTCAAPGLDIATLVILLGLPIGGVFAGWQVAAQYLAKPMKGVLAIAGLTHALA